MNRDDNLARLTCERISTDTTSYFCGILLGDFPESPLKPDATNSDKVTPTACLCGDLLCARHTLSDPQSSQDMFQACPIRFSITSEGTFKSQTSRDQTTKIVFGTQCNAGTFPEAVL